MLGITIGMAPKARYFARMIATRASGGIAG
jgi:hypothetical protein